MFIKYHSLVNDYNVNLDYVDLDTPVYVTEKIDGSNVSLCVKSDGTYRWASRNKLVADDWNGIDEVVPEEVIQKVTEFAVEYGIQINLYGEVFSNKILRRIPYGSTKVRFYDIAIDGNMLSSACFYNLISYLCMFEFVLLPIVYLSLGEALAIDVEEFPSNYATAMAEGIVIKPAFATEFNSRVPAIKKKRKEFFEKRSKIKKEVSVPIPDEYLAYLNESRVLSVISKHGEVDRKMIGQIIKETALDALEDIKKGHDIEPELEKSFLKYSGKVLGRIVPPLIKV